MKPKDATRIEEFLGERKGPQITVYIIDVKSIMETRYQQLKANLSDPSPICQISKDNLKSYGKPSNHSSGGHVGYFFLSKLEKKHHIFLMHSNHLTFLLCHNYVIWTEISSILFEEFSAPVYYELYRSFSRFNRTTAKNQHSDIMYFPESLLEDVCVPMSMVDLKEKAGCSIYDLCDVEWILNENNPVKDLKANVRLLSSDFTYISKEFCDKISKIEMVQAFSTGFCSFLLKKSIIHTSGNSVAVLREFCEHERFTAPEYVVTAEFGDFFSAQILIDPRIPLDLPEYKEDNQGNEIFRFQSPLVFTGSSSFARSRTIAKEVAALELNKLLVDSKQLNLFLVSQHSYRKSKLKLERIETTKPKLESTILLERMIPRIVQPESFSILSKPNVLFLCTV